MKKKYETNFNEFWASLISAILSSFFGNFITNTLNLHWIFLAIIVAVLFILFYNGLLFLFNKKLNDKK